MTSSRAARSRAAPTTRRRSRRAERVPKVNDIVDIWWGVDKTFYRGRLTTQNQSSTAFRILYDDGETEDLDLVNEYWKFADDDRPPPPDSEQIVDVVLDGSHQPQSTPKPPKPKSTKPSTTRSKPLRTSDDERDKDYVEEEDTPESKPKRPRSDSEKSKKHQKKPRKQPTTSDKTSSASRLPAKSSYESRHAASHISPSDQALPNESLQPRLDSTSSRQKNMALPCTDSKLASNSHDGANALPKNKNGIKVVDVTPSPPPAPDTRPSFRSETPRNETLHMGKSHTRTSAITKTTTTDTAQPRTAVNDISQVPPTTPSTGNRRLTDTVATSQQVATIQHKHIDNQRDLATIQAEPSLLPTDRPSLPHSSEPTASGRRAVISKDAPTSFVPYKQGSPVPIPSTSPSVPPRSVNKSTTGEEMGHDFAPDEGPSPASVPVKVAIRPRNGQGNVSGSGISNPSRARGEASTEHSGIAEHIKEAAGRENGTVGKRSREDGKVIEGLTEGRANGEVRPKRSKTSGTVEGARASAQPHRVSPLTHFAEHDPTLAILVNRRLNPIERHLRSLSEDLPLLTTNGEAQRKINEAMADKLQRLEEHVRKEVRSIKDEMQAAQADRQEKQKEIVKLLHEMKEGLAKVSASQPGVHTAGASTLQRSTTPNGYNMRTSNYQRGAAAPGASSGLPQISQRGDPVQDMRSMREPPSHNDVELPIVVDSDDDVNLSPRRIAAPMPSATRSPVDMNANKVNQLPVGSKSRITSVVARQITVWLLETPHEFDRNGGISVDTWARQTSAGAFERVADRLSHFDCYAQAHQTLSTSLGNDAVEMSWFTRPEDRSNVMQARRNYAAWDPPPSESEWQSECVLLTEIANGFHRALDNHVWRNEDDLSAAVLITKNAAAWYGIGRGVPVRQPSSGNHVAMSQAHRTSHATHHNGTRFIRSSR